MSIALDFDSKSNFECEYQYSKGTGSDNKYCMRLKTAKKTFVLDNMPDFTFVSGNSSNLSSNNLNAKATLQWMFPDFDEFIKSKVKVTMKNLGFSKWK